jgi:hypothetical protein
VKRHQELRPRESSYPAENTSANLNESTFNSLSAQRESDTGHYLSNNILQSDFSDTHMWYDWTVQDTSFQDQDLNQPEILLFSTSVVSVDPSIDYSDIENFPAFDSMISQVPIIGLERSDNSTLFPLEDNILPESFHSLNPETILNYPDPSKVTLEYNVENLPTTLSILPSNSKQHSIFQWPNSSSPFNSIISGKFQCQNRQLKEPVNRGLGLENASSGDLDAMPGDPAQINSTSLATSSFLPDPYRNYLQLSKVLPSTAYMHIAIRLGINLQNLATTKFQSPFYRTTTPADDPKALLAAAAIPSLPAHLQPTLPQILFPHQASFDLLPFPVLRARAIALSVTSPQLVNPKELKLDILQDGLICWHTRNGGEKGNGQPWDVRSWEAAPWFLKKWRMLFD